MLRMLKLEQSDIITQMIGRNFSITPTNEFHIILSTDAARELINDLQKLMDENKFLDCQACGKVLDINTMYSIDACSEKCQNIIFEKQRSE